MCCLFTMTLACPFLTFMTVGGDKGRLLRKSKQWTSRNEITKITNAKL